MTHSFQKVFLAPIFLLILDLKSFANNVTTTYDFRDVVTFDSDTLTRDDFLNQQIELLFALKSRALKNREAFLREMNTFERAAIYHNSQLATWITREYKNSEEKYQYYLTTSTIPFEFSDRKEMEKIYTYNNTIMKKHYDRAIRKKFYPEEIIYHQHDDLIAILITPIPKVFMERHTIDNMADLNFFWNDVKNFFKDPQMPSIFDGLFLKKNEQKTKTWHAFCVFTEGMYPTFPLPPFYPIVIRMQPLPMITSEAYDTTTLITPKRDSQPNTLNDMPTVPSDSKIPVAMPSITEPEKHSEALIIVPSITELEKNAQSTEHTETTETTKHEINHKKSSYSEPVQHFYPQQKRSRLYGLISISIASTIIARSCKNIKSNIYNNIQYVNKKIKALLKKDTSEKPQKKKGEATEELNRET